MIAIFTNRTYLINFLAYSNSSFTIIMFSRFFERFERFNQIVRIFSYLSQPFSFCEVHQFIAMICQGNEADPQHSISILFNIRIILDIGNLAEQIGRSKAQNTSNCHPDSHYIIGLLGCFSILHSSFVSKRNILNFLLFKGHRSTVQILELNKLKSGCKTHSTIYMLSEIYIFQIIEIVNIGKGMSVIDFTYSVDGNQIQVILGYPNIPNIQYKFQLSFKLYEQLLTNIRNNLTNPTYSRHFHATIKKIVVKDLKPGTMYRAEIRYKWGSETEKDKKLYFSTPMQRMDTDQIQTDLLPIAPEISRPDYAKLGNQNQYRGNYGQEPVARRPASSKINRSRRKSTQKTINSNNQLANSEILMKMIGQSERVGNKEKIHKLILEARNCRNTDDFINEKQGRDKRQEIFKKKMMVVKGMVLFDEIYQHREGHQFFKNDWFMGPFYSYDQNESKIRKY